MKEDRIREAYDEINLYEYLRVMWKWRWLVALGVIVATLVSIPASCVMRSYESEGILRLSEELKQEKSSSNTEESEIIVTLPDYKIYSAAFTDSRTFKDYLKGQDIFPREEKAAIEEKLMAEPSLEAYIKPVYAYTEKEIRAPSPDDQFISAVQLRWDSPSPKLAQGMVDAMGLFMKDVLEKKIMQRYVTQRYQEAYTQVQELGSKLVNLRFSLEQKEKKLADLKHIAQRSPETEQLTSREVVSVEQGGHRYLPPSTQMVAVQVEISDTELIIADTERQLKINQLKLDCFTGLKEALQEKVSGRLFDRLVENKEEFFLGKDVRKDEVLIVRNEVSADFAQFEHRFHDVMQFISGPTLPKRAKPSKQLVVGVTFFLGLFFFTLIAFFLEFIQRSRQREKIAGKTKGKSR